MKLLCLIFVLISCSSLEDQISNEAPKTAPRAIKAPRQQVVTRGNLKPRPYSRATEALKGQSLFYKETTDGATNLSFSGNDKIHEIVKLCRKRNLSGALAEAKKHSIEYSKWPSFWNALGICYYHHNEIYKARTFFRRAIAVQSTYSPAYNNLGLLDIREDYPYAALSNFKLALKYNTSSQVSSFNTGRLYLRYGLGIPAIQYFSRIKDPTFYREKVAPLMAIAQVQAGNYRQGVSSFSKIPVLSKNQKLFYAYGLAKVGRKQEARKMITGLSFSKNQNGYYLLRDTKRLL